MIYLFILFGVISANAHNDCHPCACYGQKMFCQPSKLLGGIGLDFRFPSIPKHIKQLTLQGYYMNILKYDYFKERSNLERVIMKNNKIIDIEPNAFDDLVNLEHLDLSNNELTQLPDNLRFNNVKLWSLNVADNVALIFTLGKLPANVKTLNAYNTSFIMTPKMLDNFPQIKTYNGNYCLESENIMLPIKSTKHSTETTPASEKPAEEKFKPKDTDNVKHERATATPSSKKPAEEKFKPKDTDNVKHERATTTPSSKKPAEEKFKPKDVKDKTATCNSSMLWWLLTVFFAVHSITLQVYINREYLKRLIRFQNTKKDTTEEYLNPSQPERDF